VLSRSLPRRYRTVADLAAELHGGPVGLLIRVRRYPPALVTGLALAEIVVLVAFVMTGSPIALALLFVAAAAVVWFYATDQHLLLGQVAEGWTVFAADRRGRPLVNVGTATVASIHGARFEWENRQWWVDGRPGPRGSP
jgi:hypothetical protein